MGNPFSRGGYVSLRGHAQVASVRFLPTGELLTAGDTSMRLWHSETGKVEKLWRLSSSVETCCCSQDGRYIACGVSDGLVFVFEARTRVQIAHWQAHAGCGQGPLLQFFADSTYLLSAAVYTCKIWSSRTTKLINAWDTTFIASLHISPDCTGLAVGSNTGVVTIHHLPDGSAARRIHVNRGGEVWAVAFAPDRSLMATAAGDDSDGGGVRIWSTETWELLQCLRGHIGLVLDCAFSKDSSMLVTCGLDRTLRIWRRRDGAGGSSAGGDGSGGSAPAGSGDAGLPSTGALAGSIVGTSATAGVAPSWYCDNVLVGHGDAVLSCAVSFASPGIIASGAFDGSARAWRLADVPQFTPADAAAYGLT